MSRPSAFYNRKIKRVAAVILSAASKKPNGPSTISLTLIPIPETRLPATLAKRRNTTDHSLLFFVMTEPINTIEAITHNTITSSLIISLHQYAAAP